MVCGSANNGSVGSRLLTKHPSIAWWMSIATPRVSVIWRSFSIAERTGPACTSAGAAVIGASASSVLRQVLGAHEDVDVARASLCRIGVQKSRGGETLQRPPLDPGIGEQPTGFESRGFDRQRRERGIFVRRIQFGVLRRRQQRHTRRGMPQLPDQVVGASPRQQFRPCRIIDRPRGRATRRVLQFEAQHGGLQFVGRHARHVTRARPAHPSMPAAIEGARGRSCRSDRARRHRR